MPQQSSVGRAQMRSSVEYPSSPETAGAPVDAQPLAFVERERCDLVPLLGA